MTIQVLISRMLSLCILLRFYLFKTFKHEFINCKQGENKYVFNFGQTCTTHITITTTITA